MRSSDAAAFRFEPVGEGDLSVLHGWLRRPHVTQWWGEPEPVEALRAEWVAGGGAASTTRAFIAWWGDAPVGFIQSYVAMGSGGGWWEDMTDPGVRGIDQFLADGERLGQGIGRAMVGAFVDRLFADPAVTCVQTDPDPTNLRAIRCYTHAGFRPVRQIVTPDGPALLMHRARPPREPAP